MNARVVSDGREESVEDIGVERLLVLMDAAEKGPTFSPG